MNRRIVLGAAAVLVLAAGYFAFGELSDIVKTWYADNYMPRTSPTVATEQPSQVCLTVGADPRTTIAVQWRTSPAVSDGAVQFREKSAPESAATEVAAKQSALSDPMITNDPVNHRYDAEMGGLKPATTYAYRVGSKQKNVWSAWIEFTTAPEGTVPFTFGYVGDPQLGLEFWGKLMHTCFDKYPQAAFYVVAGDIVNRGKYRDEWDTLFLASEGIFDRRPMIPLLGNHDYSSLPTPDIYLKTFRLPENGPKGFFPERAYSFRYSNALFVILDANLEPKDQVVWLEEQLKNTDATWKFVCYHQPSYSSSPNRDNPEIRKVWGEVFDKYHVDIALQGHDHAYLRTFPMKGEKKAASFADGTVYIVSVSGTKYYDQADLDYTEVGFTKISTYQIIDIETTPKNKLTYRAYDIDGNVKDEFVIEK